MTKAKMREFASGILGAAGRVYATLERPKRLQADDLEDLIGELANLKTWAEELSEEIDDRRADEALRYDRRHNR